MGARRHARSSPRRPNPTSAPTRPRARRCSSHRSSRAEGSVTSMPGLTHRGLDAQAEAPSYLATRSIVERRRLAILDPAGEADAVHPLTPQAEVLRLAADIDAEREARTDVVRLKLGARAVAD